MPEAEVAIDEPLVRALLHAQHPDLARLALARVGEGWDNVLFRLGDALTVRLPRRQIAAALIEHEQRWLPHLAPHLPVAVPAPVRVGRPGCGFPWSWTITSWFAGATLADEPAADPESMATQLGGFLAALHRPASPEAPANAFRRTLAARHDGMIEQVGRLARDVDARAVLREWTDALAVPPWPGPSVWLHGDLHPGNLVSRQGSLVAVIDFGDLTAGDPAIDLSAAWMLFPPDGRRVFRAAAATAQRPIDADTWQRARGWALTLAVSYLAHSRDNRRMADIGSSTIRAVLDDVR